MGLKEKISKGLESGKIESLQSKAKKEIKDQCYAIEVIICESEKNDLILEHKTYQTFRRTNNRYSYHPENPEIPVKAHYHIYPPNSKKEIYAVNVDGTAHHKKNRSYSISSKEAKELRLLGVKIPINNIIEVCELDLIEEIIQDCYSLFIIIESNDL